MIRRPFPTAGVCGKWIPSLVAGWMVVWGMCGCSLLHRPPPGVSKNRALIQQFKVREGAGQPRVAIKDLIDVQGVVTTAGSEFLFTEGEPAKRDAACLRGIRQRGLPIVGKANTTEFAVSVSGINTFFGTPRNPRSHWLPLIPGGSSSGSAVAVASGMADIALGTDTAGSMRVPAACCGVVGLKTTFGMIPMDGIFPIAPEYLDTVGPMATDVAGVAVGMDLLKAGFEGEYRRAVAQSPSPGRIRIGRLYVPGTAPEVDDAIDRALFAAGFVVVKIPDSFVEQWLQAERDAETIATIGADRHNSKFRDDPGVTLKSKLILVIAGLLPEDAHRAAVARRSAWVRSLRSMLRRVDFIALPTLKSLPPTISPFADTTFEMLVMGLQNTAAVNLGGVPALALPVPYPDKHLPLTSLQLIGRERGEAELLNAGRLIEAANPVKPLRRKKSAG